jgi:hypothetical protein
VSVIDVHDVDGVIQLAAPMPGRVAADTTETGLHRWQIGRR